MMIIGKVWMMEEGVLSVQSWIEFKVNFIGRDSIYFLLNLFYPNVNVII